MVNIRKSKTALKFDTPSSWWGAPWREALPLGNGVIGASVVGGAAFDTIMLTHAGLKWQGNISVLPDISDKLKDVRKLLEDGKYKQAEELYPNTLITKNYRPAVAVPLPLCDLKISMPTHRPVKDYMRVLNLENGEASVVYKEGATKFDRSMFVSRENDCFVCEINKSGNLAIDVEFSFDLHDRNCVRTPINNSKIPDGLMTKYEPYFMYFSARNDNGTEFGAVAKVSYYGGTQEVTEDSIKIKGASNVLIIVKTFIESQREKDWKKIKTELSANKLVYDKMLKAHSAIHSKLLNTVELEFNAEEREQSIDSLLHNSYKDTLSAALLEKLWYFGRYLFISGSADSGNILANPYGLWCGDYKAPDSSFNLLQGGQLLYSNAYDGNLAEYMLPFINYYEGVLSDLKKNAQRLYNCKGIYIPPVTSPNTGMPGSVEAENVYFISGSALVSSMFFDYYNFTGDKKFLKERVMPFMHEAASFYEDFLKVGDDGFYYTSPSYSPLGTPANIYEKLNGKMLNIAKNSEIDFALLRILFTNLISGSEVCGLYKDEVSKWQDMLSKIPSPRLGIGGGYVHEYNTAEFSTNFEAGFLAQLYGVHIAGGASCGEDELKKAYLGTIKKRLSDGILSLKSYTLGFLANASAALRDSVLTYDIIEHIVKSCLMKNLVTTANDWRGMGLTDSDFWATYQLQGNIAITSAITGMLVQSCADTISILPALPAEIKSGSIEGVMTRSGCEVSLNWDRKRGTAGFTIKAKRACEINIKLPDEIKRISKGHINTYNEKLIIEKVSLGAGKSVSFELKI